MITDTFKGWDWTELLAPLGLPDELHELSMGENNEAEQAIKNTIGWASWLEDKDLQDQVVGLLLEYLESLIRYDDHYAPLWKGLSRIDNVHVFFQMYNALLGYMWT